MRSFFNFIFQFYEKIYFQKQGARILVIGGFLSVLRFNIKNMSIIFLDQKEIPTHYYNILPDLSTPLDPPLHPATQKPISPEDLAPLFPMELIKQEMSQETFIRF